MANKWPWPYEVLRDEDGLFTVRTEAEHAVIKEGLLESEACSLVDSLLYDMEHKS